MLLHWMQTRCRTGEAAGASESAFFAGDAGAEESMVPVVYHAHGRAFDGPNDCIPRWNLGIRMLDG